MRFPSPIRHPERLGDYHYDNERENKSRHNYAPVIELRSFFAHSISFTFMKTQQGWNGFDAHLTDEEAEA